jgi:two-component sensor histidine kinase
MLNNAVQNAGRFARSQVRLSAKAEPGGYLTLRVEDDGPGFSSFPPKNGVGLMVGQRLADLHVRHERHGTLQLRNGSALGGAIFELTLP